MSGGGGGGTSTTVQSIPDELKPLASAYTSKAIDLSNQPFQSYTGQRYAGPTAAESTGLSMIANRALQGSPLMGQANQQLQNTMGGGFLGRQAADNPYIGASNPYAQMDNPYLSQSIADSQGDLVRSYNLTQKPAWDKAMQSSGSFGNTGVMEYQQNAQNDLMRNLGRIGTDMRMGAYNQQANLMENQVGRLFGAGQDRAGRQDAITGAERGFQNAAIGLAPQFASQDYADANNLLNAGAYARNFDQQNRDFSFQQYQDRLNLPYKQLGAMSGVFGSNLGGTSTTTSSGGGK